MAAMVASPDSLTCFTALEVAVTSKHSRLPTYQGDRDTITGILYIKDLLPYVRLGEMDTLVKTVARPATYVPESLRVDRLLKLLQSGRRTMAIVTDEYGGTAGLVTMEDLLEEIVGDIQDEYDIEQPEILQTADGALLCDASVGLHELANMVGENLPTEEFDSLGGIVLEVAGRIPAPGDTYRWGEMELTVEEMDGPRIAKVRVRDRSLSGDEAGEKND